MCAAPQSTALGPEAPVSVQDELAGQLFTSPPRFVLISTAGVVELEKRRCARALVTACVPSCKIWMCLLARSTCATLPVMRTSRH